MFYEREQIASAIVWTTPEGSTEYSPILLAAISPARPKRKLAAHPASKGGILRAQIPESSPESTSPLPPLASAGEPVGLIATRAPSVMIVRLFFKRTVS